MQNDLGEVKPHFFAIVPLSQTRYLVTNQPQRIPKPLPRNHQCLWSKNMQSLYLNNYTQDSQVFAKGFLYS